MLNFLKLFRLPFAANSPSPTSASSGTLAINRGCRQFTGSAIVDEEIRPHQKGYVRFRAGWWLAQCDREIVLPPGEIVEVIGIREITLIVRPRHCVEIGVQNSEIALDLH